ncbi:MAG: heparinase II/III family protein [Pseudomonadota bacterium]
MPRDLPPLDEPKAGRLMVQYAPADGAEAIENPPRFTWLPVIEDEARYVLRVSADPSFPADATTTWAHLPLNVFTPPAPFAPGEHHWSYAVCDGTGSPVTAWSAPRRVHVAPGLPETPLPLRADRLTDATRARPRLWMTPDRLGGFRDAVADDPDHCGWRTFFDGSVLPWMDREVMGEPAGYPDHKRVAPIWRQTYIDCQELLYAIRHLAIGGAVMGDAAMTERAKAWLLEAASWSPTGTTSRAYTDEWAFRVNLALAWGYDWLKDELSPEEAARVRDVLLARTRETADHLIRGARIHLFPYDSHAVRAVSAVLVPAAIALLDDAPEAEDWLHYATDFLWTVYSPWGDADGGWAEGPHYWMTGMAYLIDAANLLKSYTGLNLYDRPFFRETGDFPLYTKAPDTRRATFGDDATMGDLPSVKIGTNLRQFAGVTGDGAYQWYHDEIAAKNPGTEMAFYNWGWWDFRFDELCYRTDWPEVAATPPEGGMRHFRGIGWVALQEAMDDPARHIQFVFKSSPFGSISHSHGDQNAFCLSAFGEDLAIQSGHYVAFNSSMHQDWRRQTHSKNAILIDGKGQYAGRDKVRAMGATGRITAAEDRGHHVFLQGDATEAYRSLSPQVTSVLRDVYFVNREYFLIVDAVDAETPVSVDWLLHANAPMDLGASTFRYTGERAGFYGQVLWSEAGAPDLSQETGFPGVDPADYEGLPASTRLTARYPEATRHRIATLLVPYPLSAPRRVFSFLDDQGYDCDLYFTDAQDRAFKVVVPKTFDVGPTTPRKDTP